MRKVRGNHHGPLAKMRGKDALKDRGHLANHAAAAETDTGASMNGAPQVRGHSTMNPSTPMCMLASEKGWNTKGMPPRPANPSRG